MQKTNQQITFLDTSEMLDRSFARVKKNRQLTSRTLNNSITKSYTYDNLNRLTQAVNGGDTDSYTYSSTGNILTHNGNSYTYTNTQHPQAVTSYDGINYTYDTNGNLTSDSNGKTYEYDQLQRLTSISELALPQQSMMMKTQSAKPQSKIPNQFNLIWKEEGETGNSQKLQMEVGGEGDAEYNTLAYYEYNDARQRVAKITNGNTKKYISTNIEKFHNNTYQNHIFAGASRVATKQNNALTYNHPNHLSSNVLQTDSSGAVQYSTFIRPFGVSVGHAGTRMHSYIYTDQELDYDTGLMYYDARYYNPAFARFTSPDSVATFSPEKNITQPQKFNIYSYVENNPIVYIDPNGKESMYSDFSRQLNSLPGDMAKQLWDGFRNAIILPAATFFGGGVVGGAAVTGTGPELVAGTIATGKQLHDDLRDNNRIDDSPKKYLKTAVTNIIPVTTFKHVRNPIITVFGTGIFAIKAGRDAISDMTVSSIGQVLKMLPATRAINPDVADIIVTGIEQAFGIIIEEHYE